MTCYIFLYPRNGIQANLVFVLSICVYVFVCLRQKNFNLSHKFEL